MTARKAPAPAKGLPVGNVTATRQAKAQSRQAHPAGKKVAPAAKPAAAKKAAAKVEAEKLVYSATARCGKVNQRQSATPLVAAMGRWLHSAKDTIGWVTRRSNSTKTTAAKQNSPAAAASRIG